MRTLLKKIGKSWESEQMNSWSDSVRDYQLKKKLNKTLTRPAPPAFPGSGSGYHVQANLLSACDHRRALLCPSDLSDGFYVGEKKLESDYKPLNFSRIIPKEYNLEYLCDTQDWLTAVKHVSVIGKRANNMLSLSLNSTRHWLHASCAVAGRERRSCVPYQEVASTEVEVFPHVMNQKDLDHILFKMDCTYLRDWLDFLVREKIETFTAEFTSDVTPVVFRAGIYLYLSMPMTD